MASRGKEVEQHEVQIFDSTPVNQWEQEPHTVLGWCEVVKEICPLDVKGVSQAVVSMVWVIENDQREISLFPQDEQRMQRFVPTVDNQVDLERLVNEVGVENFSKSGFRFEGRAQLLKNRNVPEDYDTAPVWLLTQDDRDRARGGDPEYQWPDKDVEAQWRERGALVGKLTIDPVTGQKVFVEE